VNDTPRRHAVLDVTWLSSTRDGLTLPDQLAVALDDLEVAAIHESDSAWRVFFPTVEARDLAARVLGEQFRGCRFSVSSTDIADEDWARRSQADLQPVRVGRLIVAPPWSAVPADAAAGATVIRVLPSMGFGTGHHATTRLCLQGLQDIDVAGQSFLDIGTGSGVLAIAACLLGARPVSAIDSDPDAIDSAAENLRLNGVDSCVHLMTSDFHRGGAIRARAVTANLTGAALAQGHLDLAACVEPGGMLIASGFMRDEAEAVLSALSRVGDLTNRYDEDGWCAATLRVFARTEARHD
jgi:ribosomal protein L11 methyltransferase